MTAVPLAYTALAVSGVAARLHPGGPLSAGHRTSVPPLAAQIESLGLVLPRTTRTAESLPASPAAPTAIVSGSSSPPRTRTRVTRTIESRLLLTRTRRIGPGQCARMARVLA